MKEKDVCLRWFHYVQEDAKAAQEELEERASEGWELEELGLFFARFRRAAAPRRCWVEPVRWNSIRRKEEERRADFMQLCGEAGWELLEEAGGLWYFRAAGERVPAPIQTDGGLEWESVWKKALWERGFNLLYLALFWGAYFLVNFVWKGFHPWEMLLSGSAMMLMGIWCLWVLMGVVRGGHVLRYRRQCRRAAEAGEPFPVPSRRRARLRGCWGVVQALLLALLLLTALLGAGEETRSGELGGLMRYESGSGFVRHTEYRRLGEEDWLYLDDYDCRYAWLAEAICADLVADEADERKLDLHFHAPVTPQSADLGFDAAWRYDAGGRAGLIFRSGRRVVRAEAAGTDFTDENVLAQLREAFASEGA